MSTAASEINIGHQAPMHINTPHWPLPMGFWYAQIIGWYGYFIVHYLGAVLDSPTATWWASLSSAVAGFILTSAMRPVLQRYWKSGPVTLIVVALLLALICAVPYSAVSEQAYWLARGKSWFLDSPIEYLGNAFWCGSILLTWVGIYYGLVFYQQANRQKIKAAEALATAREARLQVLKERLNPHFLFNTLNSISTLVLDKQNTQAACMLDKLCELLRKSIDERPSQFITLAEELELAELYLQIQHTRFAERLRVNWQIDPKAHAYLIPSMVLQPLLENAVQYAVQPDPAGADINISAQLQEQGLYLVIEDTGRLSSNAKKGSGVGHSNLAERLNTLYPENISFHAAKTPQGYRVELQLPQVEIDD